MQDSARPINNARGVLWAEKQEAKSHNSWLSNYWWAHQSTYLDLDTNRFRQLIDNILFFLWGKTFSRSVCQYYFRSLKEKFIHPTKQTNFWTKKKLDKNKHRQVSISVLFNVISFIQWNMNDVNKCHSKAILISTCFDCDR